jgi:hypothetical protein
MELEGLLPVHKSSPLVSVLSQLNLARASLSEFFKIRCNIILPSMPSLPSGPFPSGVPH